MEIAKRNLFPVKRKFGDFQELRLYDLLEKGSKVFKKPIARFAAEDCGLKFVNLSL